MSHGDEVFFERWQARHDPDAFAELVSRHSGMMYAAAKRVLGSAADAEDVVQESFLRLAQQDRAIASLPGWLYQVTVRLSLSRLRGEKRRRQRERRYHQERPASQSGVPQWDEILPVVDEAVAELPEKVRAAIVLRFIEGRTHAGAAEELGVSRSAVQKRIERGLEQIRVFLDSRGITSSSAALGVLFATHLKAEAAPPALLATLGKQTLASMGTAPTVANSNLLLKGAIAMSTTKTVTSLGLLAIGILLAFWAVNASFTGRAGDPPPDLATMSGTDDADSPTSVPPPGDELEADTVALAQVAPEDLSTPTVVTGPEDSDTDSEDEAKAAEGPASVAGLVQDEDAWPVADARVWFEVTDEDDKIVGSFDTRTGTDGGYVISGITAVGFGSVFVNAKEYVMAKRSLGSVEPYESHADVDFVLTRASYFVKGVVVTEADKPVAGAEVSLVGMKGLSDRPPGEPWGWSMGPRNMFTVTATDGHFELAIPRPASCTFVVVKEGLAEGRFSNIQTGTEDARFVLPGFGAIAGRVMKWDGRPATGTVVTVAGECDYDPDSRFRDYLPSQSAKQMTITDVDGNYRLEGLSPSVFYSLGVFDQPEVELRKHWRKYWLKPLVQRQDLHVDAGAVLSGIDFKLAEDPFVRLSGRIFDEASGQPVVRVSLGCTLATPYRFLSTTLTDDEGAYRLEFTLNEEAMITLISVYINQLGGRGAQLKHAEDGQPVRPISMSPGDEMTMDFLVRAPVSIPVRVVDAAGHPVPGAGVGVGYAHDDGQWDYAGARAIPTDSNGRCVCTGLPPDQLYFVWAQELSGGVISGVHPVPLARYGPIQGEPGETVPEVVLVIEVKGGIEGIFVDAEGYPLTNVPIVITASALNGGEPQTVRVQTSDDGHITIVHALLPARYPEIAFSAVLDGTDYQGHLKDIEVIGGAIVDLGVMPLHALLEDAGEPVPAEG